ncbi:hypothetical protein ADL26_19300, partial [Thermoactinomyces vulgaris]
VVDLGDAEAAGGEVGDVEVEDERGVAGGPAVRPHHEGRELVPRHGVVGVVGRVDVRVDLPALGAGERADLRFGVVGGVDRVAVLRADHPGVAGGGVQLDDLVRAARAGG